MSLFQKPVSLTDDYQIRMDAMNLALDYTLKCGGAPKNKREFLQIADAFFGYLSSGDLPEILGEATKTVLKGQ